MGTDKQPDKEVKRITIVWFQAFGKNCTEVFFDTPKLDCAMYIFKEMCNTAVIQSAIEYAILDQETLTGVPQTAGKVSLHEYLKTNNINWNEDIKRDFYKNNRNAQVVVDNNVVVLTNCGKELLIMVSDKVVDINSDHTISEEEKRFQQTALLLAWEQIELGV